ncbi:MAG: integral rane protein [Frankiales bacterium]|jgi:hypothetical protein|nr:integral rane protein [Frankiales bacterium]
MRALYTLLTLAAVAGLYVLMLKGWRSRQRRQGDLPPPPVATGAREPLLPAVPGLFVGTTAAGDWLDRIAVHDLGHRASGWLTVATNGVHVEREGLPELYLPYDAITQAATGDALAGKVVGRDGMLLLDWHLGDRLLTSGFRADDHAEHQRLVEAISTQKKESA